MLFLPSQQLFAENLIRFNIEKQRADKAIIAFAQKTQQTILFSFDITKKYQTNALKGYFSLETGLKRLLNNSGLIVVIDEKQQFSIHLDHNYHKIDKTVPQPKVVIAPPLKSPKTTAPQNIEKIVIVGSRMPGRTVNDLPVPVDILSAKSLRITGHNEVAKMLQTITPSFNFSSSAISDGTDALRPATLRGLGPDQTLVLVNGKRRHQASLIHINSSVGRGATGTDMNAIGIASIKRIEVLRDGAAAQYGSDAIAGVINIVLNDDNSGGSANISYGEFTKGDGETTNISLTKGLPLGETGFLSVSADLIKKGMTNRAGLHGACQYSGCTEVTKGVFLTKNLQEINASRNTFQVGDATYEHASFALNAGYDLAQGQLYGFATFSNRDNVSATFFRHNNDQGNPILQDGNATIADGFLPKINSTIKDLSYNLGYKVAFINNAAIDLSYTYGKNSIDYLTSETLNASYANALIYNSQLTADEIRARVPREAAAYGLALTLQTLNIDFTQDFELFSLALGGELRTDQYQVSPGDEYSYQDYDTVYAESLYPIDLSAGTQGFRGIGPVSAVNETRKVISFYLDIETAITDDLRLSSAIRYDNYKDFNDHTSFKLAAHWLLNSLVSLRSSISTGFRAPSMQQLYFNNISTQFVNDPSNPLGEQIPLQVGTFRNDSRLALAIGIPQLKEENAVNFSLGSVFTFTDKLNLTIDYYAIDIADRIVISDKLAKGLSPILDAALKVTGTSAGQFFLNGADTETRGIDIIATWQTLVLSGELNLTLAANFTDTKVVDLFTPQDSGLGDIPPENIFSPQDISIIEEWQPQDRISLTSLYKINDFTVNVAFNRYGEYTITDGSKQTYGAELLTDLQVKYQVSEQFSVNVGGNNIFDVYPDTNAISNSRAGTIIDENGNVVVSSDGVFAYSRRSAPFGFNGAYYYAGLEYQF